MNPVVILEEQTTRKKTPLTTDDLNWFAIARTPEEVIERGKPFKNPVMTSDKIIVDEAIRIESLFTD